MQSKRLVRILTAMDIETAEKLIQQMINTTKPWFLAAFTHDVGTEYTMVFIQK